MNVQSEVGVLRSVILHRPNTELRRLTPGNVDELLFDDVLWVQEARRQHDAFADVIRDHDVEVLYLADLLTEALAEPEARRWVMDREVGEDEVGTAARQLTELLDAMSPEELAWALIGGVTVREAGLVPDGSLWLDTLATSDFVLRPLPNSYFMRDSSCWVYGGAVIGHMARTARRREANHTEAILRFHPRFRDGGFELWRSSGDASPGFVEGGDILVIGRGVVLCGLSERTTAPAIEVLAKRWFASGQVHEVVAVELPRQRSSMHLDTVCTMADPETFLLFPGVMDQARVWSLRPADGGDLVIDRRDDFEKTVARALGVSSLRTITTGGDELESEREQWDDGNNVLALRPGVVVAYDRNVDTNTKLRREGIEVITVPSSELSRGRGGPRCMSCPIERDPAQ